jgi:hypothetical protein
MLSTQIPSKCEIEGGRDTRVDACGETMPRVSGETEGERDEKIQVPRLEACLEW